MSIIDLSFMQRYQGKLNTAIKNYVKEKNPNEKGISIAAGTNLDNFRTVGVYYIADDTTAGQITNLPANLSGKILVSDNGNNGIVQFYIPNHEPKLYERVYWNSAWSQWKEYGEGGGGGTSDYSDLDNKPSVNGVTLNGNKTSSDLKVAPESSYLIQTLSAGQTTVTFTSELITATSMIDVYTSVAGLGYTAMTGSVGSVTVTYEAQQSNITVVLEIKPQPTT